MSRKKGVIAIFAILVIFLGPGSVIYWMAHTFENHFIDLPYLGWEYKYDEQGNKIDSSAYNIPSFKLTSFDGTPINRDSIKDKFIIVTTIQNDCEELENCGLGLYHFNEIIYSKFIAHPDNYSNVRVLSILTDKDGNPDSIPSPLLREMMSVYDQRFWWQATGDPSPFVSFPYYGDLFKNHPATPEEGEIGSKAFVSAMILIDKKGFIRGVSGAKRDADMRNFFDLLKLLKKEEFKAERAEKNKSQK